MNQLHDKEDTANNGNVRQLLSGKCLRMLEKQNPYLYIRLCAQHYFTELK